MASTTLSDAAAIAECAATIALVNAGAGPGKLQLMSAGNVVLMEFVLDDPAFDAPGIVSGAAEALAFEPAIGVGLPAAGTGVAATYFKVVDSDSVEVMRGDVSNEGGNGSLKLNSTTIVEGVDGTISSWKYRVVKTTVT